MAFKDWAVGTKMAFTTFTGLVGTMASPSALYAQADVARVTAATDSLKQCLDNWANISYSAFYTAEDNVRDLWSGYDKFCTDNGQGLRLDAAETNGRYAFLKAHFADFKTAFAKGAQAQQNGGVVPDANTGQPPPPQSPNAPASLEPQAAIDQFWTDMGDANIETKTALNNLKDRNSEVYKLVEQLAAEDANLKTPAAKKANPLYVIKYAEKASANETAIDTINAKVADMQKQVNLGHVEDMALQIVGLQDASKSLGEDIQNFDKMKKEERKQRNKDRMANLLAMQARVAVATAGNAVLGSLEKEADLRNNEKVSEAIRNMRYIYEDAFGIRERGAANTDMSREWGLAWNEIQRDLQAYEKLTDEKKKLEAEKKIHDKVAKAVKKECERFCKENGITDQEMKQIFSENGITAVGPRTPQGQISPETLEKVKGISAEYQTALAAATAKPDFDTAGNLIATEKNFAANLKYAPKGSGRSV